MKNFVFAAALAAAAGSANADYTVTLTNQTFTGFNFISMTSVTGGFSGSLTGVSINVTLNASVAYTYADDLCVYVDFLPLSTAGLLQVGGFSNLNATQRLSWSNGGSDSPGTTCIDSKSVNAIAFGGTSADPTIWVGNGYGASGTSGTWTGTVTLHGVNAVPAPGAMALLGLGGLVAGRRRR
jgi:MYXO-CTERM domain-containing protein